jgi:hypothetical protein
MVHETGETLIRVNSAKPFTFWAWGKEGQWFPCLADLMLDRPH